MKENQSSVVCPVCFRQMEERKPSTGIEIQMLHVQQRAEAALEKLKAEHHHYKSALERIRDTWDISDVARVVPKHHKGELAPNDSLAASAIVLAIEVLK